MVLVVAGLIVAGAIFLKRPAPTSEPVAETSPVQKTVDAVQPETNTVVLPQPVASPTNAVPQAVAVVTNEPAPAYASEAEHQAAIDAEKNLLAGLAMNNDPESLSNILAALQSPDKEVRMAAIDAARQFEDTNAIPALRAAAYNAPPDEAIAMLNAVQWLETPTADLTSAAGTHPDLTAAQAQAIIADQAKNTVRQTAVLNNRAAQLNGQNSAPGGQNNQSQPGAAPGSAHAAHANVIPTSNQQ